MIHGEKLPFLSKDLQAFKKLIEPLRCKHFPAVGNHEVIQREGHPKYEAPYDQAFGPNMKNYAFRCDGLTFIVVNNAGARGGGERISNARNAWLQKTLERHRDVPKILACHIPLVPVREEKVLKASFGFNSYKTIGDQMLKIVETHQASIIAILCGHIHLSSVIQHKGMHQICPSGPASYPSHFTHFSVFPERIDVHMHQPPKILVGERIKNNLHGKPRWKDRPEYLDSTHSTPETYVAGNPKERTFSIKLPKHNRPLTKNAGQKPEVIQDLER